MCKNATIYPFGGGKIVQRRSDLRVEVAILLEFLGEMACNRIDFAIPLCKYANICHKNSDAASVETFL
jgi:hypothetical protein